MKYGKTDSNQREIVEVGRQVGADVIILSDVGKNCPDTLFGFRGYNFLIEIKTTGGKLSQGQELFIATWPGQVAVARSVDEMLGIIGVT